MLLFRKYYFFIPAIIFLILYFPSIFYGTAWGDDPMAISPQARDFGLMLKSFYDSTAMQADHYLPFFYLQCFIVNLIFGENAFPFGFHLYLYVSGFVVCILASILFYQVIGDKLISTLIVIFWTVHPINLQMHTRLLVGPTNAAFAFCLVFLICYLQCRKSTSVVNKILLMMLGSTCFILSIMMVEWCIHFPVLLCLIYLYLEGKDIFKKRFFTLFLPLFLTYLIYFGLRLLATQGAFIESAGELIRWTELGSIQDILFRAVWLSPQLLVHYLKLFFFPFGLMDSAAEWYMVGDSVFSPYSIFCQLFVLGLIAISIALYKRFPLFSLGMFWFFISFVLTIQIIPLFAVVALRYAYVPTLGLLLAMLSFFTHGKLVSRKVLLISLVPIITFLFIRTMYYLPSSKDFLHQHIYCAKEAPLWNRPTYYAAALDLAAKENRNSELPSWLNENVFSEIVSQWLDKYLVIKPSLAIKFGPMQMPYNFFTFRGIFRSLYEQGDAEKLKIAFNSALVVNNKWLGWYEISSFLKSVNKWELAWQALYKAVTLQPLNVNSYGVNFIEIVKKSNHTNEAKELLENYVKSKPTSSHPYLITGLFFNEIGEADLALKYLKQAISNDKMLSVNHGWLYFSASELFIHYNLYNEAEQALSKVLSFNPYSKEAKEKLALIKKLAQVRR